MQGHPLGISEMLLPGLTGILEQQIIDLPDRQREPFLHTHGDHLSETAEPNPPTVRCGPPCRSMGPGTKRC